MILSLAACAAGLTAQPQPATVRTQLIDRLSALQSHGIMFGHQDDTFYGLTWQWEPSRSDTRETCGDLPAVMGFELGGIEEAHETNLDSVPFALMRREIMA